jgi:hypothetical protein
MIGVMCFPSPFCSLDLGELANDDDGFDHVFRFCLCSARDPDSDFYRVVTQHDVYLLQALVILYL